MTPLIPKFKVPFMMARTFEQGLNYIYDQTTIDSDGYVSLDDGTPDYNPVPPGPSVDNFMIGTHQFSEGMLRGDNLTSYFDEWAIGDQIAITRESVDKPSAMALFAISGAGVPGGALPYSLWTFPVNFVSGRGTFYQDDRIHVLRRVSGEQTFGSLPSAQHVAPTSVQTVEQDTAEELRQCVIAILRTESGTRASIPEFGIPDQAFRQGGANMAQILAAIQDWEPRAGIQTEQEMRDYLETIEISVGPTKEDF